MSENTLEAAVAAELVGLMKNRSNVYALMARAFETEVDAAFAQELSQDFAFESDVEELRLEMAAMKSCLDGIDDDGIEQLAVVFDRVFFGMGPLSAEKAFPYESVYTSQKGLMMQDAYSAVVKEYRRSRLHKDEKFTEPEDHLAIELYFMRELCLRAQEALEQRDAQAATELLEQQRRFLHEHLLNWLERFAADCCKAAESGFYVHAVRFTAAFLKEDAAVLDEVLGGKDEAASGKNEAAEPCAGQVAE